MVNFAQDSRNQYVRVYEACGSLFSQTFDSRLWKMSPDKIQSDVRSRLANVGDELVLTFGIT